MHERVAHRCCLSHSACLPVVTQSPSVTRLRTSLPELMSSNLHWVTIPAFPFLTSWSAAIWHIKNTLKQLEASAALPDLHYPISSVQQASLKLQSVLAIFSPSCLPSTSLLKLLCQSHSELSGFKSNGWCLPSPPWSVFDV